MRVQVRNRPRIASTSTSAGSRCAAASGCARLPALEPGQRVVLLLRARPISISGCFGDPAPRRLHRAPARPAASGSAAATARRPAPRAPAAPTARAAPRASRPRRRCPRDDRRSRAKRAGIVASVKSRGIAVVDLVPGERRRDARVGCRPHRVGAGDGAVLGVLVVVEEDAVALFLPPLARRQRRRAPLDLARERQRGAAHLGERPAPLDAHVDVHAARARRLRPADETEVVERRAARPARPRGSAPTSTPGTGSRSTRSSSG